MSVSEPTGTPDIERPIDLNDEPTMSKPGPVPIPEHHPREDDAPGGAPEPGTAPGH